MIFCVKNRAPKLKCAKIHLCWNINHSHDIPWRIHGAAIYGVPWIPSIYRTPVMLALIYQHQPDPSWVLNDSLVSSHSPWEALRCPGRPASPQQGRTHPPSDGRGWNAESCRCGEVAIWLLQDFGRTSGDFFGITKRIQDAHLAHLSTSWHHHQDLMSWMAWDCFAL